jgi:hypothetical protein
MLPEEYSALALYLGLPVRSFALPPPPTDNTLSPAPNDPTSSSSTSTSAVTAEPISRDRRGMANPAANMTTATTTTTTGEHVVKGNGKTGGVSLGKLADGARDELAVSWMDGWMGMGNQKDTRGRAWKSLADVWLDDSGYSHSVLSSSTTCRRRITSQRLASSPKKLDHYQVVDRLQSPSQKQENDILYKWTKRRTTANRMGKKSTM